MERRCKIILISSCLVFFCFIFANAALAQNLEVSYPSIGGLTPSITNLPQYVKYIFNFAVAIAGLVALGVLIAAGVIYLTAAGDTAKIRDSKKRMQSALLGLLILLFSFLLITTINPYLAIFSLPGLTKAPVPEAASSTTPITEPTTNPYDKIKTLINQLDELAGQIAGHVEDCRTGWIKSGMLYGLKNAFALCKCKNALSMCACGTRSGTEGNFSYNMNYYGSCNGLFCYNAPGHHVCSTEDGIKSYQQTFLSIRDEMLYIKNRIQAEKADLLLEIGLLKGEIDYYAKKIDAENRVLQGLQNENAKKLEQDIISAYQDKKEDRRRKIYKRGDNKTL